MKTTRLGYNHQTTPVPRPTKTNIMCDISVAEVQFHCHDTNRPTPIS